MAGTREDARAELSRLQIATKLLEQYCRITSTRLPAAAASRRGVSERGIPTNPAPPDRDLSPEEIGQAQAPWAAAREEMAKRYLSGEFQIGKPIRAVKERPRAVMGFVTGRGSRPRKAMQRPYEARPAQMPQPGASPEMRRPANLADAAGIEGINSALTSTSSRDPPVSEVVLTRWYKDHVASFSPGEKPPTRDKSWAKAQAAFPDKLVTKTQIRALRRKWSPHWRKPGRPKSGRMKPGEKEI